MYGIRLVGSDRWIMRIPGHARVRDAAGSTWSEPPKLSSTFFCEDLALHIESVDGLPGNDYYTEASRRYHGNPSRYLEVVKVAFSEVP